MSKANRLYNIWCGIKKRCYNPKEPCYSYYGGRGITVCNEWLHDFDAFQHWSLENGYSDLLTIDRIDTNGNYSPNNCRWITHAEQQRNRSNNVRVEHNGESKTIAEWSRILGISDKALYKRYNSAIKHKGFCDYEDLKNSASYPRIYTDRYRNRKPRPSRIVEQYSLNGEFIRILSLVEAESEGFNKQNIHNCCSGRSKSACGYIWKYTDRFSKS
jgi:hypothetical protein